MADSGRVMNETASRTEEECATRDMAGDTGGDHVGGKVSPAGSSDRNSNENESVLRNGSDDDASQAATHGGADGRSGSGGSEGAPSTRRSSPEVRFEDEQGNKGKGGEATSPNTCSVLTPDPAASIALSSKGSSAAAKKGDDARAGDKNQLNALLVSVHPALCRP